MKPLLQLLIKLVKAKIKNEKHYLSVMDTTAFRQRKIRNRIRAIKKRELPELQAALKALEDMRKD